MTRNLPVLPTSAAPRTSIFSLPLDLERCEAIVRLVKTSLAYIICNRRHSQVGRVGTCLWCVEATYTPGSWVAARWNVECTRLCVALRCGAEQPAVARDEDALLLPRSCWSNKASLVTGTYTGHWPATAFCRLLCVEYTNKASAHVRVLGHKGIYPSYPRIWKSNLIL